MKFILQKRNTSTLHRTGINAGLVPPRSKLDALYQSGSIREELKLNKKTAHNAPQKLAYFHDLRKT